MSSVLIFVIVEGTAATWVVAVLLLLCYLFMFFGRGMGETGGGPAKQKTGQPDSTEEA